MKLGNFLRNLSTVIFSLSFLSFQSLLHFMKSKFSMTLSFLMKSSFSQNQILNKIRNSYASFSVVSCLAPLLTDIIFISLLLPPIYVCMTSYRLFNVPGRTWWDQQKGQHIFKIYVVNVTELYFNFLCAKFASSWTNIKQIRKGVPVAPETQPIWPQKRPTSVGPPS